MLDFIYISAFWLGILTAISPCPLATNIAAISFIGKHAGSRSLVLASGISYSLGRTVAYISLGVLISSGIFALDAVSKFLQKYMNEAIGPLMILLGMALLGLIGSSVSLSLVGDRAKARAEAGSLFWDFAVGVLFALSFCPASAAIFFAGLIPLSLKAGSKLIVPALYGLGTALPVILFAFLIAFGTKYIGTAFNWLSKTDRWIRTAAGILFIVVGIYYCINYNLSV